MYKCVIIDDEKHAIEELSKFLESVPNFVLFKSYLDSSEALIEIKKEHKIDVAFVDIDMPKINGIELVKAIRDKVDKVIFTTAHSKYAYDAFEVNADGYLLKPYSLSKFITTLHKIFPDQEAINQSKSDDDFFFVKSRKDQLVYMKIKYKDVIYIQSELNYVIIYTVNESIKCYLSLTEISKELNSQKGFLQFHRSYLINEEHILSILGNVLYLSNEINIPVGEKYGHNLKNYLQEKLINRKSKEV